MRRAIIGLRSCAVVFALLSCVKAQTPPPTSGTQNAINGINSYPGPGLVRYSPDREPRARRIDLFLNDWQGSMPRFEHGSLVLRDILTRGDNFAPPQKGAACIMRTSLRLAVWHREIGRRHCASKDSRRSITF